MAQNATKPLRDLTRGLEHTLYHCSRSNTTDEHLEMPQEPRNTVEVAQRLRLLIRLDRSTTSSLKPMSSIDSTLSGMSGLNKYGAATNVLSLDSAVVDNKLSTTLSYVRPSETVNYDGTTTLSVCFAPIIPSVEERYLSNLVTIKQLHDLKSTYPLPEVAQGKWKRRWRNFRYGTMSAYMRLWTLAIAVNLIIIIAMVCKGNSNPDSFSYSSAVTATGANLLVAALMRQEHCVNLLFRLATSFPHSTPMVIRRQAAKVYSYGGVHSGCGIAAMLWYMVYSALVVAQFNGNQAEFIAMAATTAATLLCLLIIIGMAHPKIRIRYHDQWEMSHRFAGWTALGLVWAQTMVITIATARQTDQPIAAMLVSTPTFWFLIIITCCLIYPWLRMRRRKVEAEVLSSHAVRLWFGGKTKPSCMGTRLSKRPLMENHGFATIPNAKRDLESGLQNPEKAHTRSSSDSTSSSSSTSSLEKKHYQTLSRGKGYSVLISRAGDFTTSLIEKPPTHIWTRGAPTRGVLHIAHLFSPVIIVATGAGIGPCLSFLQVYPDYPTRVIWSARSPLQTYGQQVVDAVLRADEQAVIIDTQEVKKPDLPAISWAMAKREGAEAVVIISNPMSTRNVVFALESRGMPAFGAIFDS